MTRPTEGEPGGKVGIGGNSGSWSKTADEAVPKLIPESSISLKKEVVTCTGATVVVVVLMTAAGVGLLLGGNLVTRPGGSSAGLMLSCDLLGGKLGKFLIPLT